MALGDPFSTTYEGSYKGASSLGDNLVDLSNKYYEQKMKEKLLQQEFERQKAMKQFGSDVDFNQFQRELPLTEAFQGRMAQKKSEIELDEYGKKIPMDIDKYRQETPLALERTQGVSDIELSQSKNLESFKNQLEQDKINENRKVAYQEMLSTGRLIEKEIPPSYEELKKGISDFAKEHDISQVDWMETGDEKKDYEAVERVYSKIGIPLPMKKKGIELNLKSGDKFDPVKGEASFESPKTMLSQFGLSDLPSMDAYNTELNKHGLEMVGLDQKGQPMVRKINRNVLAEKFDAEQKDKEELEKRQSEEFIDIAQDTLNTISEVEKNKKFFGARSLIPAFPQTEKVGWDANINKLLSGKILETIADMKRTSKTGATGFGQLNRAELKVLTDASTALKKTMSKEDAQPYLDKMKDSMYKIMERENSSDVSKDISKSKNTPPSYDSTTQKLQQNKKTGKYRVVPR